MCQTEAFFDRLLRKDYAVRPTRVASAALVLSLVVSAVIGIVIILIGDFDETEIRILATAATLAGFSILSLPSLFHLERGRYAYLTRVGISTSLIFFAMVLLIIWSGEGHSEWFGKTLGTVGVLAFATNHALLMLIASPAKILISLLQWATILIIVIVAGLILIAIWTEEMPEMMMRLFGTLGVLDALGTITVPILVRATRRR